MKNFKPVASESFQYIYTLSGITSYLAHPLNSLTYKLYNVFHLKPHNLTGYCVVDLSSYQSIGYSGCAAVQLLHIFTIQKLTSV